MSGPFVNATFRSMTDLADFLEATFKPECIKPGEDIITAHRRAAQVELAQRLSASIRGRRPEEIEN